jgi:hypothetical protein
MEVAMRAVNGLKSLRVRWETCWKLDLKMD